MTNVALGITVPGARNDAERSVVLLTFCAVDRSAITGISQSRVSTSVYGMRQTMNYVGIFILTGTLFRLCVNT